ncbi:MAG: DUF2249 domain-containing protein [Sulfuriferula sp.]
MRPYRRSGCLAVRGGHAFVNDHDPLPLIDQMHQRYGGTIEVEYVERQPGNIVIRFARH